MIDSRDRLTGSNKASVDLDLIILDTISIPTRGFMALSQSELKALDRKRSRWYDFTANLYYLLGFREWAYRKKAVAALNLKPGDTVVEIGCGTGLNLFRVLMCGARVVASSTCPACGGLPVTPQPFREMFMCGWPRAAN